MALRLIYQVFAKLLSWMVLHARSDTAKEIEILVLRHQLAVLQRRNPRPRMQLDRPRRDRRPDPATTRPPPTRTAGHPLHDPALAPPARQPPLDHPACPSRPPRHPRRRSRADPAPGHRESDLGLSAHPWRTRRTRLPDRRLHGLEDPALAPGSIRHHSGPDRPGRSSCGRKPTASSPATCSTSTPSPCTGSTPSSSSSTPPAACTSWASPPTPPGSGSPSRPATCSWTSTTPAALPVPHPRPRRQVHRHLRRRLRRDRHQDHQDAGAGTAGQRDRRTLRRHDPARTPRPHPDHQPAPCRSRAHASTSGTTTITGHTAPWARPLPYDPFPSTPRPSSTTFDDATASAA